MLPEQQQRILGYFIEEAKDHLNTIEQGLLNLQNTLKDPEMVNEVFRAAHSVKGGAAMLGLNSIQRTAHRLEDCFKILKECPIQVDQKLESLFLRVFDTLQGLLEQLQGPFGLTEDAANNLMSDVEPVFEALNQHLESLVKQAGGSVLLEETFEEQPVLQRTAAPSTEKARLPEFQNHVMQQLREMLQLFKQAETTGTRQQLQQSCQELVQLGKKFNLPEWSKLCETALYAIANQENTYRALAPIVIKELKQSQELVMAGRQSEIADCQQLKALLPAVVVGEEIPETLPSAPASIPDAALFGSDEDKSEVSSPELSATSVPDTQDYLVLSFEDDTELVHTFADEPPSRTAPIPHGEDVDTRVPTSLNLKHYWSEAAVTEPATAPTGPEVGMAELNSLADLFEGESPDLDETWQREEILERANKKLEAESVGQLDADDNSDLADFLFEDSPESTATTDTTETLTSLFGDDFLDEEHFEEQRPSGAAGTDKFSSYNPFDNVGAGLADNSIDDLTAIPAPTTAFTTDENDELVEASLFSSVEPSDAIAFAEDDLSDLFALELDENDLFETTEASAYLVNEFDSDTSLIPDIEVAGAGLSNETFSLGQSTTVNQTVRESEENSLDVFAGSFNETLGLDSLFGEPETTAPRPAKVEPDFGDLFDTTEEIEDSLDLLQELTSAASTSEDVDLSAFWEEAAQAKQFDPVEQALNAELTENWLSASEDIFSDLEETAAPSLELDLESFDFDLEEQVGQNAEFVLSSMDENLFDELASQEPLASRFEKAVSAANDLDVQVDESDSWVSSPFDDVWEEQPALDLTPVSASNLSNAVLPIADPTATVENVAAELDLALDTTDTDFFSSLGEEVESASAEPTTTVETVATELDLALDTIDTDFFSSLGEESDEMLVFGDPASALATDIPDEFRAAFDFNTEAAELSQGAHFSPTPELDLLVDANQVREDASTAPSDFIFEPVDAATDTQSLDELFADEFEEDLGDTIATGVGETLEWEVLDLPVSDSNNSDEAEDSGFSETTHLGDISHSPTFDFTEAIAEISPSLRDNGDELEEGANWEFSWDEESIQPDENLAALFDLETTDVPTVARDHLLDTDTETDDTWLQPDELATQAVGDAVFVDQFDLFESPSVTTATEDVETPFNPMLEDFSLDIFDADMTSNQELHAAVMDMSATPTVGDLTYEDSTADFLFDLAADEVETATEVANDLEEPALNPIEEMADEVVNVETVNDSLLWHAEAATDSVSSNESLQIASAEAATANWDADAFADLEMLLAEAPIATTTASSKEEASPDQDFAELEALLDLNTPTPPLVTPVVASLTASNSTITRAEVVDPGFDELEKILEEADKTMGGAATVKPAAGQTALNRRRRPGIEQTMRVPVKHLDNLSNLVGELVVNRNSLEQDQERLRQFLDNLLHQVQQLSDVGSRMQELYERSLLEASLLASRKGYHRSAPRDRDTTGSDRHATGMEFDALEIDQFTKFHTLSQEMIELIVRVRESASDIEFVTEETEQVARQFRQVTTQLQEGLTRSRMVPFAQIAERLPRSVRDIAIKCGKEAELHIDGRETLIDKVILEQLYDPMIHLVNNAITHGIETPEERSRAGKPPVGRIAIRAFHQGNQTVISVTDDGAGINAERVKAKAIKMRLISPAEAPTMSRLDVYDLLFHPGFTMKDKVDDYAGRGVGMDVVRTNLGEIRGVINTDSTVGKGTTFTIRLPLTLSICKALCCLSDKARMAFPMDGVEDMMDISAKNVQVGEDEQFYIPWHDSLLPFKPLKELLVYNRQLSRGSVYGGNREDDMISVVVLRSSSTFIAVQVDQVLGEQEIVIKQFEGPAPKPLGVAGATVLGDGRIMPIADVLELIDLFHGHIRGESSSNFWEQNATSGLPDTPTLVKTEPTVLIVDDSITVRELLSMTFNKAGYRVEQARDGQEAWDKLRDGLPCDLVFCDIEMPRMDGLELLSRIQKDSNLNHLPIAMLTSRGADRHRQMAVQLGASGYFTKPYLEEALLDAAQRMLKGEVLVTSGSNA